MESWNSETQSMHELSFSVAHLALDARWIRITTIPTGISIRGWIMFTTRRPNVVIRVPRELSASKTQPLDINARTGRFGLWQDHEPVFRTDNTVLDPRFCYLLIIGENHGAVDEDWWRSSGSSIALTGWLFESCLWENVKN